MTLQGTMGSRLLNRMAMYSPDNDIVNFREFPAIPTKYTEYDIYSGALAVGKHGYPVLNGGLFPRLCNVIGESATGKTSFVIGSCASAVDYIQKKFGSGYSELYYNDPENNTPVKRFLDVSNWSPMDYMTKCSYSNASLSIVDLANQIIKISETKTKYSKDFLLPSGIMDVDGREVMFLAPTFICVDSVAAVNPNGVEDLVQMDKAGEMKDVEKLGNNMEAAQDAKAWTIFVRKIKPFLDKGNIGLYCVNHKTKDLKIDPYAKETRYLPFLDIGEKVKGGKEFIFQSFNILDLAAGEKFTPDKNPVYGDKMTGFSARARFVKNKFNIEGATFPMVFDQNSGYSAVLSDMEYLYGKKYGIEGSVKMALSVLPEIGFTRKTLLDTIDEYPQLARALQFTARYCASAEMLYGTTAGSLTDFGTNVPLNQRLSIIYSMTSSSNSSDENASEEFDNVTKIAIENRHYFSFTDCNTDVSKVLLRDNDIARANKGYQLLPARGVTPFDVDLGTAKVIGGSYVLPKTLDEMAEKEKK